MDRGAPLGRVRDHRLTEIFIATAAERTRHIKLGTGVISVSYHNPLWVAERAGLERTHLYRKLKQLNIRFSRRSEETAC